MRTPPTAPAKLTAAGLLFVRPTTIAWLALALVGIVSVRATESPILASAVSGVSASVTWSWKGTLYAAFSAAITWVGFLIAPL